MLHLGSLGKTSIDVDISFLILIALFVGSFYNPSTGWKYALLWAPVLFLSVVLHELAHAAAIALLGYGSSQIVLAGMGGVTLNRRRARPWHDMVISAAGPLSSFAIAVLAYVTLTRGGFGLGDPMFAAFLPLLLSANVWWGVFNLIPVAPLDGGHVVRNFFRMFLTERTAFVIYVWIAIIAGIGTVILGLLSRYFLLSLIIGWYVFQAFQSWQAFRRSGYLSD